MDLKEYYIPRLEEYGPSARGVGWGSTGSQLKRFAILEKVGDLRHDTILDVGCGVGDLAWYLGNSKYTGIDILPEMINEAQKTNLLYHFEVGDIYTTKYTADYVVASGIFTFSNIIEMHDIITTMWHKCNKAIAFNSLSTEAPERNRNEFYADSLAIVDFCRLLTPYVVLRHDYMQHDFTVFMYKEPNI